jgi:hypothetical protein
MRRSVVPPAPCSSAVAPDRPTVRPPSTAIPRALSNLPLRIVNGEAQSDQAATTAFIVGEAKADDRCSAIVFGLVSATSPTTSAAKSGKSHRCRWPGEDNLAPTLTISWNVSLPKLLTSMTKGRSKPSRSSSLLESRPAVFSSSSSLLQRTRRVDGSRLSPGMESLSFRGRTLMGVTLPKPMRFRTPIAVLTWEP